MYTLCTGFNKYIYVICIFIHYIYIYIWSPGIQSIYSENKNGLSVCDKIYFNAYSMHDLFRAWHGKVNENDSEAVSE